MKEKNKKLKPQKNKLNIFTRLKVLFSIQTIRFEILKTFGISCLILIFTVILFTSIVKKTMTTLGDTYQTNAILDKYLLLLSETESAMESYLQYRTFESIDKYYTNLSLCEQIATTFQKVPSSILAKHKEYLIFQLSNSFFNLSGNAIAARRANNLVQIDHYYNKAVDCYSFLREEIYSLNMSYFKDNAQLYQSNKKSMMIMLNILNGIIILFLIGAVFIIYRGVKKILDPLLEISSVALKVADRDFDIELFKSTRKDEIGNICRAFDAMIISIREYIDTIWEKAKKENELHEKEIEMRALITESHFKALQEQIKPHFLFNTLNTGAGLAMMEGADKTCYFLEQVADFLRYNIQHPGQDATISDELGMLDNYIYIMKVRFGSRYEFIKEIDETILHVNMPNMILQPLVENCIKHGLKDIIENGIIKICVQKSIEENMINISISDNGSGFSKDKKEEILKMCNNGETVIVKSKKINQNEHISTGLVNVISRLNFYFKRNDVFFILDNESEKGTTFLIKIPYV